MFERFTDRARRVVVVVRCRVHHRCAGAPTVRWRQIEASDPAVSAFVPANAGAGKTHVLAQRVIRLLLSGVDPGNVSNASVAILSLVSGAERSFAI